MFRRERQRLQERYENWQKMRELALKNAGDKAPPEVQQEYPLPPPDDEDLGDVSLDLTGPLEPELLLDETGIERVPTADPGMGGDEPVSPLGQNAHARRRGVLSG